ncbi:MAG: MFS transporter [Myxococcota bacterium]|nr:MFS transporter [Myxococcota bacterium]
MPPLFTRSFVALLAAQAFFGLSFSSFFLLPKFMSVELGAGPAEIGRVSAVFFLAAVLLQPLMGSIVDRRGRRAFLTAGALLMAPACAGFVFVDSLGPLIYLLRTLQGLAFAMAFVAGSALAVDEAPPERLALALGIFGLTMLSNNALAPVLVEAIADRYGWEPAFLFSSFAAGISALLSLRVRERPVHATPAAASRLGDLLRRPEAGRVGLVVALAGAVFGVMFTFSQPFALELGMEHVRSLFVAYTVAAIVARLGLGPFADRLGRRRVAAVALVFYTAAAALAVGLGSSGLVLVGAAFGIGHGLFYPTYNALAVQDLAPHERGKGMALFNAAFNVGFTVGVFALGILAAHTGYPWVFGVASGLAVLAFLGLVTDSRHR